MRIRHAFHSDKADGHNSSLVQASAWNADHVIEGELAGAGDATAINVTTYGAVGGTGAGGIIDAGDISDNPQWIGTYVAGDQWDYVGTQEAIYAAYASASTPGNVVWNKNSTWLNRKLFVPQGFYSINRTLECVAYGLNIEFETRLGTEWRWVGDTTGPLVSFNAIAYALLTNFTAVDSTGEVLSVVELDYTGSNVGLKTQQITFINPVITGGNYTQHGLRISASGGAAQGDTILFVNPGFFNFYESGLSLGGQNTLSVQLVNGDFQSCWKDAIANYGGSVIVNGTSFQNQGSLRGYYCFPQVNQITRDGADVHNYYGAGPTCRSSMTDVRSEGDVLGIALSSDIKMDNSSTAAGSAGLPWYTATYFFPGALCSGGTKNKSFVCVDDPALDWFSPAGTSTSTSINRTGAAWTVNQWAGYMVGLRYSQNSFVDLRTIASNTADTLTLTAPLTYATTPGDGTFKATIKTLSGVSEPNWDAGGPGYCVYPGGGVGVGATTTAASAVVVIGSSIFLRIAVNDWVMIPEADSFTQNGKTVKMPLYAKVLSIVGSNVTLSRAAAYSITDAVIYFGAGINDNGLTWIECDFNGIYGINCAVGVDIAKGRAQSCGTFIDVNGHRRDFRREDQANGPDTNLALTGRQTLFQTNPRIPLLSATGMAAEFLGGGAHDMSVHMAQANVLPIPLDANTTFNTALLPNTNISQQVTFVLTGTGAVATFGTNFVSGGTITTVSGKRHSITFAFDGLAWVELSRTSVP